jgi:hypothetical protein
MDAEAGRSDSEVTLVLPQGGHADFEDDGKRGLCEERTKIPTLPLGNAGRVGVEVLLLIVIVRS